MMRYLQFFIRRNTAALFLTLAFSTCVWAQQPDETGWQFGGGVGVGVGSGYTNVMLAPGAIYNFNQYVAAGFGLQGSYVRAKNHYESYIYGGSVVALFSPVPQVQLSAELEQLRVNTTFSTVYRPYIDRRTSVKDNFWNTALYVGAGYRVQNVTIGIRYNVLFDRDKSVYSEAFMPFIRAYF